MLTAPLQRRSASIGQAVTGRSARVPPVPARLSRTQMNLVFVTVLVGMLLSALDQTIVATALPTIVGDLGGGGHLSWVVTAYLLAETISTVLAGKSGDLFGRKRVFQFSVVTFIVGSLFCGLANNLAVLVAMRGLQGLGGGGLAVTSTALIGEVIPLRERGRYQGAFGAVFGLATVVGPLLGGVFTDQLSWRWAFYVNVPIALIVFVMAARTIPDTRERSHPAIDYLGVLFIALGSTGLILATSWGGAQYPWGSSTIIGLLIASAIALGIFVQVERRAAEPILPMRLFKSRVFTTAAILSFIVGFAMMGSITFLPVFLQYARGASATVSGLRTLPVVIGLLVTAILSGQLVARTGRYKAFPIVGSAITAVGLYLMSRMSERTPLWQESLFMLVFGAGIGLIIQILVLVVQNTSDYRDLGAATSGVTFFRTLGSSFGASIFGTIYSNYLSHRLPAAIAQAGHVSLADAANPAALHALPASSREPIMHAYADALHYVFVWAVPVAIVAFLLALFLPQVAMRDTARSVATDTGDGFGLPESPNSDDQLEKIIARVLRKRTAGAEVLARSNSTLDLATAWGLLQIYLHGPMINQPARQSDLEAVIGIPAGVLTSYIDDLAASGYLRRDADMLMLTDRGATEVGTITTAYVDWVLEQLAPWLPDQPEQRNRVATTLNRIAVKLVREQQQQSVRA
jgi:EmrB/QacA subfamily drug resistance transporter